MSCGLTSILFIIKLFRIIIFIFIVISTTFRPIWPLAFFRCLSNSGTFTELRTTSFIESTRIACSDSVCHNRGQVLSMPVLILACSKDWTCNLQIIEKLMETTPITVTLCILNSFRVSWTARSLPIFVWLIYYRRKTKKLEVPVV